MVIELTMPRWAPAHEADAVEPAGRRDRAHPLAHPRHPRLGRHALRVRDRARGERRAQRAQLPPQGAARGGPRHLRAARQVDRLLDRPRRSPTARRALPTALPGAATRTPHDHRRAICPQTKRGIGLVGWSRGRLGGRLRAQRAHVGLAAVRPRSGWTRDPPRVGAALLPVRHHQDRAAAHRHHLCGGRAAHLHHDRAHPRAAGRQARRHRQRHGGRAGRGHAVLFVLRGAGLHRLCRAQACRSA